MRRQPLTWIVLAAAVSAGPACDFLPLGKQAKTEPTPSTPPTTVPSPSAPAPTPVASPTPTPTPAATVEVAIYRNKKNAPMEKVGGDFLFRSGDQIRFGVRASQPGRLILLQKGSSGAMNVIYPDKRITGGSDAITAESELMIPQEGWFTFDKKPGSEVVYALFSPEKDLLMASVEAAAGLAGKPARADLEKQVLAQLNARARDLHLDGSSPEPTAPALGDAAATPGAPQASGSLVWAVTLKHE